LKGGSDGRRPRSACRPHVSHLGEYALKAVGLHKGNGPAEPDWRAFAERVSGLFDDPCNAEFSEAVEYILAYPPKKQVIEDGVLSWCATAPNTNLKSDLVLQYIRRVRNNLFHGGKFNGRWFEPERSQQLLKHSLVILAACLDASSEVGEAYRH
jgi:hypothetical protein